MKNLTYYRQQKKRKTSANRFQSLLENEADKISNRIKQESDKRWEDLLTPLRLQRCKLNESIATYPYRKQNSKC